MYKGCMSNRDRWIQLAAEKDPTTSGGTAGKHQQLYSTSIAKLTWKIQMIINSPATNCTTDVINNYIWQRQTAQWQVLSRQEETRRRLQRSKGWERALKSSRALFVFKGRLRRRQTQREASRRQQSTQKAERREETPNARRHAAHSPDEWNWKSWSLCLKSGRCISSDASEVNSFCRMSFVEWRHSIHGYILLTYL